MTVKTDAAVSISPQLLEAIDACQTSFKVRSFSAHVEVADIFDAVILWMSRPGAELLIRQGMAQLKELGEE